MVFTLLVTPTQAAIIKGKNRIFVSVVEIFLHMLKVICFIYAYVTFVSAFKSLQFLCYALVTPADVILHLGFMYEGYSVILKLEVYSISLPLRDRLERRLCELWVLIIIQYSLVNCKVCDEFCIPIGKSMKCICIKLYNVMYLLSVK